MDWKWGIFKKLIIFILNTGLVVSKPTLVTFLEQMKELWDVCRKKVTICPPPQVGGNGYADVTGEKPKGHRGRQTLKVGLGNCASMERILQSPGLFLLLS